MMQDNNSINFELKFLEAEEIIVSSDKKKELLEVYATPAGHFVLTFQVMKKILVGCNYWKQYLEKEEDFNTLVINVFIMMHKIHCAVINCDPESKGYIGNYISPSSPKIPEAVKMIFKKNGEIYLEKPFGPRRKYYY